MGKLQVSIILEILGRPKEHLTESLNALIDKMNTEKGTRVKEKTIHEPVLVKDSKDLFTTFSEVFLELDSLEEYFEIMFRYMPSHIELINPEEIALQNSDLNQLASKLMQRLHDYDALAKKALMENDILLKRLNESSSEKVKESKGKKKKN